MTRRLTIQPDALEDANEAYNWYENQLPGLGGEFYRELTRCIDLIVENPLLFRIVYRNLRKRKIERFPYVVFYYTTEKELSVISIFPAVRDPSIWKKRANRPKF
jgi:plasmid stabilization system protein ParE